MRFPDVPDSWTGDAEGKARFELLEIVLRAGDSDPKRRYTDTTEMLADLAMLQAGKSLRQMRRMETRLRRAMQVLAFAALVVALAGGAWMLERHRRQDIEAAEKEARTVRAEKQKLLGESLVTQAQSERKSGEAGAREKALSAALRAHAEGAPLLDVRTQAASALGLFDIGEFSPPWPADRQTGTRTVASDDGHFMATGFDAGKCRIFERDAGPGKSVCVIEDTSVTAVGDLFLSAHGRWLAAQTRDRRLVAYDAQTGARVWEIPAADEPTRPAFAKDAAWLAVGTARGIETVEAATGKRVVVVPGAPKLRHLCLAPDGTWIAALASGEKGFRIYTGLPGRMPDAAVKLKEAKLDSDMELDGPSISGDSRYLAAAVGEDRLRVWAIPGGQQMAWLRGHQRTVRGTAFHPFDSSIVASTSYDGTVRLWDIPTRQQILAAPAGGDHITFVPDRNEILLRNWAGDSLRVAPLDATRAMRVLMLPPETPFGLFSGVAFSSDGKLVAAAGDAGVIVWVLATGQIVRVRPAEEYVWRSVLFSPDGKYLWVASGKGLFRHALQSPQGGTLQVGAAELIKAGRYRELAWAGGRIVVTHGLFPAEGARDGQVSFIGPDGSTETVNAPHFSDMLAVSADGRWVATSNYPQPFGSLIDMHSKDRAPLRLDAPSRCTFAFLPNQPLLAIGSDRDIRFQPLPGSTTAPPAPLPRTFSEFIPARFALSPDGALLAASTGSTELSLFNARSLTKIATLDSPLTPFDFSLAFSPDGSHLALAGGVSRVVVWDLGWLKQGLAQRGLAW